MFRRKTPEEIAAQDAERQQRLERHQEIGQRISETVASRREVLRTEIEEELSQLRQIIPQSLTLAEQARQAFESGANLFQAALTLSSSSGSVSVLGGAQARLTNQNHASTLDGIERLGWRLEHASYVFRITETTSRDKLLSSGQQEAVSGEIVAVYIFRRRTDGSRA